MSEFACPNMDPPGLKPHPYSANKFLIFIGLHESYRCKVLL